MLSVYKRPYDPLRPVVCNRELVAWQASRNAMKAVVNWQFTTETARVKLKRLYPTLVV